MFLKWIRQWRQRRARRGRAMFGYSDGTRQRWADPAAVWRQLLGHAKMDFATMVPLADQGQEPEATIVVKALCEIFDVVPWDDSTGCGLTTWEILDLVRQFDEYLAALKKNISPSRMPWLLSAYGYSAGPDSPDLATNSSAASSSTPDESSTAEPTDLSEPLETP